VCYMLFHSHCFDHPNNIWWSVQVRLYSLLQPPGTFSPQVQWPNSFEVKKPWNSVSITSCATELGLKLLWLYNWNSRNSSLLLFKCFGFEIQQKDKLHSKLRDQGHFLSAIHILSEISFFSFSLH
jgi:hypothetical protein